MNRKVDFRSDNVVADITWSALIKVYRGRCLVKLTSLSVERGQRGG